ncbi:hypothetical protein ACFLX5_00180 [Chloroflexota bacterium]
MEKKPVRKQSRRLSAIVVLVLVSINLAIVYPLFQGGYTSHLSSIETAFIADAEFISANYPYTSWNPLWYLGFPFHLFYTPLLPYMVATAHKVIPPMDVVHLYHILSALFYILTPVSLYFMARYLFRRQLIATSAAIIYSVLPSFCYIFSEVRADDISHDYAPWQLQVLTYYGEGPHISALAVTPIAVVLFLRLLRKPTLPRYIWAALAVSAVALFNLIGLFALSLILAVVLFSEVVAGDARRKLLTGIGCALLSLGLVAAWYNPSFIGASLSFGGEWVSIYTIAVALALGLLVMAALFVTLYGRMGIQPYFVIGGWALVFLVIALLYFAFDISLAPQPKRYMPELNMAAAALGGAAVGLLYDRLRKSAFTRGGLVSSGFLCMVALGIVLGSVFSLRSVHSMSEPHPEIAQTSEYRMVRWLGSNLSVGERVYATGSHAFWLNVFTDVPQLRGGTDQGATNPWWAHVAYQINKGSDGEVAVLWCRALNIKYLVVNYPDSSVPYKDYALPDKFEGLLTPVYRFAPNQGRGDIVYEVPLAGGGLARTVDGDALGALSAPSDAIDSPALEAYVDLVDSSSRPAQVTWLSGNSLDIDCSTVEGEVVVVMITWDKGWRASLDGKSVPIWDDPLGFVAIDPGDPGQHRIELRHHDTPVVWFFRAITVVTILVLGYLIIRRRRCSVTRLTARDAG